jgi:hypothetical protein
MREGIYRIKITSDQVLSKAVAIVSADGIRALDQNGFYTGSTVTRDGKKQWDITPVIRSLAPGLPPGFPPAFDIGEEFEDSFRLDGKGDYGNTKFSISGTWLAELQ